MKTKSKQKALLSSLVIAGAMIIFISSGFSTPFLTIEKGGNKHTMKSEIPVPVTVSPEIIDNSQVSELSLEIIENFQKDLLAQDTIKKDQIKSMSDEEWKIYKENLEKSQEVLKNIDWAAKQEEFEKNKQEMISQMAMNIEENKVRLQEDMRRLEEEMKSIDKDKIRQQLEKARQEVDSLRENFDLEKFEKEFEKAMQEMDIAKQKMESMLQDSLKLGKEIEMAIQSGMKALQELNIEEMMEDLRISMEGIDIDFDFDFDSDFDFDAIPEFNFNLDSIMIETQKAVEAIDFEEIRRSMDEALHEMEAEMKEMEKERNEKKEQK